MKTFTIICTFIIFLSCTENKSKSEFLLFEIRLAEAEPIPNLVEMTMYNSDLKFFVDDSVFLNNDDLTSAEVIDWEDWETHPKVMVILNDDGRDKFAVFTQKNIGKNAAILIDHRLFSAPRINASITEGKLIIVGNFSHEEALKIVEGIIPKE
jgi:preprotein translocase subunit SecD